MDFPYFYRYFFAMSPVKAAAYHTGDVVCIYAVSERSARRKFKKLYNHEAGELVERKPF